jgi:predicted SnoaL-like aldol condensation-catalyzing enzyme
MRAAQTLGVSSATRVHRKVSQSGKYRRIATDIIRMKDGILLEHWDVIQDEATQKQSKSGNPMFGDSFPNRE